MRGTVTQSVQDAAAGTLRDYVALALLGLGIQFAVHEYIGGLFLALAGAAISRAWEREAKRKRGCDLRPEPRSMLFLVAATAFFVATMTAIFTRHFFPALPPPVVMACAGFASRRIVYAALNFTDEMAKQGNEIARRVIDRLFPGGRDENR